MHQQTLILRSIGFVASLLLTLAAYFIIIHPESFSLLTRKAVLAILLLALCQSMVQFFFFIDLWREKGPLWNITVFISTLAIIFVVVFFSMWIMGHLNSNMVPSYEK